MSFRSAVRPMAGSDVISPCRPGNCQEAAKPGSFTPAWAHSNCTINRASSACVVVAHGVKAGEIPRRTTPWVTGGAPPAAVSEGDYAALAAETEPVNRAEVFLAKNPSPSEMAAFEKGAAERALSLLKSIR